MDSSAKILIKQPGATPFPCTLPPGEYTIGRSEKCRIRLRHPEVSEVHAVIRVTPGESFVEDKGSSNGTWVFGGQIAAPTRLAPGMEITVGPYKLAVVAVPAAVGQGEPDRREARPEVPASQDATGDPAPQSKGADDPIPQQAKDNEPEASKPEYDPFARARREIKNQIHKELVQRLDLKRLSASRASSAELNKRAKETLQTIVNEVRSKLPPGIDADDLAREIYNEALRLGPLEAFLADDTITEIMVNGPHMVYVERKGKLELTGQTFMDDASGR